MAEKKKEVMQTKSKPAETKVAEKPVATKPVGKTPAPSPKTKGK